MNRDETRKLLAAARTRDNRKITDELVTAWQQDLDDIPYDLAEAALRWHYKHSHEWLMAAHIRDNAAHLQHQHRRIQRRQREAQAAQAALAARDTRPLRDRSPALQALIRQTAAQLTTPTSLAINARWRAKRIPGLRAAPPSAQAPPSRPPELAEADRAMRERQAVQALHAAGHPCGTATCSQPTCRNA